MKINYTFQESITWGNIKPGVHLICHGEQGVKNVYTIREIKKISEERLYWESKSGLNCSWERNKIELINEKRYEDLLTNGYQDI